VIVKHTNPCGTAVAERLSEAFLKARSADPVSSFGGIIGLNRIMDEGTARLVAETFFEAIIAPGYSDEALKILAPKKNLRLMQLSEGEAGATAGWDLRRVSGGLLVQSADVSSLDLSKARVVTKRQPTAQEWLDLSFAWTVVKHVKSNAIVFAREGQSLGVGAGQMSRVDSVKIAVMKAAENFKDAKILKGAAVASDAFFPFRDGLDAAAQAGAVCVVQPGGSVRDDEVIAAADEQGMAMIFTGERHFKH
jgi:phosphoribosylaminoimidazolecarboxamide formyltransferase/IMP cyclohydrolase